MTTPIIMVTLMMIMMMASEFMTSLHVYRGVATVGRVDRINDRAGVAVDTDQRRKLEITEFLASRYEEIEVVARSAYAVDWEVIRGVDASLIV